MIEITIKIPRQVQQYTKYIGDAEAFVNQPIVANEKVVGIITEVISFDDDYIDVKGILYKAGASYFVEPELKPCSFEIP